MRFSSPYRFIACLALIGSLATAPQAAARCNLGLVLALDVSASVDAREYGLLRAGTAAALASPDVRAALKALGGVRITVFEWSGRHQQVVMVPWTLAETDAAIDALAALVAGHTRSTAEYPTALGSALGSAATMLRDGAGDCLRRVIDMAGDGVNNHGFAPRHAYTAFDFEGVTVNGLVVENLDENGVGADGAAAYYTREVLRGPGAFLEVAATYDDFEEAMKRKLLREIGVMSLSDAGR